MLIATINEKKLAKNLRYKSNIYKFSSWTRRTFWANHQSNASQYLEQTIQFIEEEENISYSQWRYFQSNRNIEIPTNRQISHNENLSIHQKLFIRFK